jgi:TonB-dependent receptor
MGGLVLKGSIIKGTIITILLLIAAQASAFASTVEGIITDAVTKEPLYGANVIIVGTGLGSATDVDGNYKIANVAPGKYTIRVSYIGYKTPEIEVTVKAGTLKQDFSLDPVGLEGETVVVTAQAVGQKQAINQQLTSDQIVNVVSAAKIKELPDANAAESVGRLPGVSILRSGGEGYAVVIRGLAPKYNQVMIDGIQMASSSSSDRSTNLSMVSSDMLEGIQVSKTLTADMDASVLGGVVNFELREASANNSLTPRFRLEGQGSYNALSNIKNPVNNFKYLLSAENRYFDERLGVFVQFDVERKNLSHNSMGASYTNPGENYVDYEISSINLYKTVDDRQRYNGALVVDYKLPDGKIKFTNLFSTGKTSSLSRGELFNISNNTRNFDLGNSFDRLSIITNGIDYQQDISAYHLQFKASHSYSESKTPESWTAEFLQTSAGLNNFNGVRNLDPKNVARAGNPDLSGTYLNTFESSKDFSKERAFNFELNAKTNFRISDLINADVKAGASYKYQTRYYDYTYYSGTLSGGAGKTPVEMINSMLNLPTNEKIMMNNFIDPAYEFGKLFDGDYSMIAPLNYAMLSKAYDLLQSNVDYFKSINSEGGFGYGYSSSKTHDHEGHEGRSAAYVTSTFKIGTDITFIPGVRYQNLRTTYTGIRGSSTSSTYFYNSYDTTVTKNHGYWLPDISLKYKPFSWFDIRLSYTNTLSYPDYNTIIPRVDMSTSSISFGNYNLKPSRSTNYDVYLSFYENTLGLLTVGGFLKQIKDMIYGWTYHVSGKNAMPYLPWKIMDSYMSNTVYTVGTYVNNPYKVNDYGMELDWQTHFWYLPGPLSGLVFNINYTHIFSKAEYPYFVTKTVGRKVQYIDSSYTSRLIYQPDDVLNLSIGFDYKDFSARVSMLYQSDIFTGTDFWPQLRAHTAKYQRWDLSVKQNLPWYDIQVYGDINNINGEYDKSVIAAGGTPTSLQEYGMVADIGIRLKL